MPQKFIISVFVILASLSAAVSLTSTESLITAMQHIAQVHARDEQLTHATVAYVHARNHDRENALLATHYTEAERSHLADVRTYVRIIDAVTLTAMLLLIVCIVYRRARRALRRWIAASQHLLSFAIAGLTLGVAGAWFAFDTWFERAHVVLFADDSWIFAPDARLVTLFPERFWLVWCIMTLLATAACITLMKLWGIKRS